MGRRNSAKVYQEENEAIAARPSTPNAPKRAVDIAEELEATDRAFFEHLYTNEKLLPPLGSHLAPWRRRWSSVLLLLTAYEACYLPFCAAFQLPRNDAGVFSLPVWLAGLQWLIDLLFVIDTVSMFRTTLQSTTLATTDVITDVVEIRRLYLNSTFRLDVSRSRISTCSPFSIANPGRALFCLCFLTVTPLGACTGIGPHSARMVCLRCHR